MGSKGRQPIRIKWCVAGSGGIDKVRAMMALEVIAEIERLPPRGKDEGAGLCAACIIRSAETYA